MTGSRGMETLHLSSRHCRQLEWQLKTSRDVRLYRRTLAILEYGLLFLSGNPWRAFGYPQRGSTPRRRWADARLLPAAVHAPLPSLLGRSVSSQDRHRSPQDRRFPTGALLGMASLSGRFCDPPSPRCAQLTCRAGDNNWAACLGDGADPW